MKASLAIVRTFRGMLCGVLLAAACVGAAPAEALKPFQPESLQQIREATRGRPFVLAFWSLHCAPCKEDMAVLKAVQAKYPQLRVILVSTDGPAEHPAVIRFLAQQGLGRVERWAFADDFEERLRFNVDPEWRGELPRTYLFDAEHRATTHSGVLDVRALDAWVARAVQPRRGN